MTENKIERYLIDLKLSYRDLGDGMWLVEDDERRLEAVAIVLAPPVVILRVVAMKVPHKNREAFFLKLLQLNSSDLLHGAYAVEGEDVVIVDTLEYDTMDLGDFQASLDAIGLALVQHYPVLSEFRDA